MLSLTEPACGSQRYVKWESGSTVRACLLPSSHRCIIKDSSYWWATNLEASNRTEALPWIKNDLVKWPVALQKTQFYINKMSMSRFWISVSSSYSSTIITDMVSYLEGARLGNGFELYDHLPWWRNRETRSKFGEFGMVKHMAWHSMGGGVENGRDAAWSVPSQQLCRVGAGRINICQARHMPPIRDQWKHTCSVRAWCQCNIF